MIWLIILCLTSLFLVGRAGRPDFSNIVARIFRAARIITSSILAIAVIISIAETSFLNSFGCEIVVSTLLVVLLLNTFSRIMQKQN